MTDPVHDPSMANAFVPGKVKLTDTVQALADKRSRLLGPAYRLMYEEPLYIVRGEGVWLYDADGRRYLDAYNNVTSLGHCHPEVVAAISRQAATLATNTRYLQDGILEYSEALLATLPDDIENLMFTCTGSEANDLAYRIAKTYSGGAGVIVTETAYHGITDAVSQFSPSLGKNVALGSHVQTVTAPNAFRRGNSVGDHFVSDVKAALEKMQKTGIKPAALIIDSMFTSDGVLSESPGFLATAAEAVRQAGGVYIADEVQSGFARTGEKMWGFERHGVAPDIVTMGKPMGNGFPVAAIAVRANVVNDFGTNARYFNTFGGNAVACAAASAVLKVIQRERLMENAAAIGAILRSRLAGLGKGYSQIGDVRGAGLMIGVEIVDASRHDLPDKAEATRLVNGMRSRGVLISSCGANHNVLKIRPPLVFTQEHVEMFVDSLERTLQARAT